MKPNVIYTWPLSLTSFSTTLVTVILVECETSYLVRIAEYDLSDQSKQCFKAIILLLISDLSALSGSNGLRDNGLLD